MPSPISPSRIKKYIFQFSVFAENKVGCLNAITQTLVDSGVYLLGMSCLDQTECAVVRFIPDYTETAETALKKSGIAYSKTRVIALELHSPQDLINVTRALGQAEINIHYLYPLFCRPGGLCGIILSTDDLDLSESVLRGFGINVLDLDDLVR